MQRLEVSGAVRPLYWSLGVKGLNKIKHTITTAFQMPGNNPFNIGIRLREVKVKVKFTLEQNRSTLSLISALDRDGWSTARPGRFWHSPEGTKEKLRTLARTSRLGS